MARNIQIVDFTAENARAFEILNLEWLEKYFHVEEVDRRILSDPQAEVIDHGGHILFARIDNETIGTVALKHQGGGCYELTKMAVTSRNQGGGIGRALLLAAIGRYEAVGGNYLYLESHSSLVAAITLYQSAGFQHAPHPGGSDYARSDTYMAYRPD